MERQTPVYRRMQLLTLLTCALVICFFLFFDQSKHHPPFATVNPFLEDPFDATGSFGIQLAILACLLSLLRLYLPGPKGALSSNRAALVLRGDFIALFAIFVTLAGDLAALVRFPQAWAHAASGWTLASLAAILLSAAGAGCGLVLRAAQIEGGSSRTGSWLKPAAISLISLLALVFFPASWHEGVPDAIIAILTGMVFLFLNVAAYARYFFSTNISPEDDLLDDLFALYTWLRNHAGYARSILSRVERLAAGRPLRPLIDRLNPRRHGLYFVFMISFAAGAALFLIETLVEGAAPAIRVFLLVMAVYLSMECTAMFIGYSLFNRFLGIIRPEKERAA